MSQRIAYSKQAKKKKSTSKNERLGHNSPHWRGTYLRQGYLSLKKNNRLILNWHLDIWLTSDKRFKLLRVYSILDLTVNPFFQLMITSCCLMYLLNLFFIYIN